MAINCDPWIDREPKIEKLCLHPFLAKVWHSRSQIRNRWRKLRKIDIKTKRCTLVSKCVLELIEHFTFLTHDSIRISVLECFSNVPILFGFLGSSKRRRKEELLGKPFRRPQHELDTNGLVPLPVKVCFSCNRLVLPDYRIFKDVHTDPKSFISYWFPCISSHRSCRLAPLIQCDYCPLLFHMDCLDPPLTALPAGKWMCPNHVEHLVVRVMALAQSKTLNFFLAIFFFFFSLSQPRRCSRIIGFPFQMFVWCPAESEEPEPVQPLSALRPVPG